MPDYQPLIEKAYDRKTTDEVVELYRDWAESYDDELADYAYVAPERGAATLARFVADRTTRIIDVGCGTGLVGRYLAEHGFTDVDGLDISAAMLEQARAKGVYEALFTADLTGAIDVPDAAYGAAISVGTFTHNHVGPDGLDEVLRIVAPGGIASITVNGDAYVADGYRARFDALVDAGACSILEERDEEYIVSRGTRSRIVVLKKA